ncbi:MAG TPA: hypothetical protein VLF79_03885 [Candidatus Saccharimonadales bacterium]|nr:hypothetical protein [Candidatus Saccharimonadales bacterium]
MLLDDVPKAAENSQVFVYRKVNFGFTDRDRVPEFTRYVLEKAEKIGSIAVDSEIIEVKEGVKSLFPLKRGNRKFAK